MVVAVAMAATFMDRGATAAACLYADIHNGTNV